jgi:hypothetical protein
LAFSGRGSLATVESRHIDVPVAMPGRSDWGGKHFKYFSMAQLPAGNPGPTYLFLCKIFQSKQLASYLECKILHSNDLMQITDFEGDIFRLALFAYDSILPNREEPTGAFSRFIFTGKLFIL